MKKIIIVLIISAIIITLLAGCSVPVQNTLQSQWQDYEKYTYSITNSANVEIGTLILESTRYTNETITIGGTEHAGMTGTKIEYEMTINNSTDKISSEVLFSPRFAPLNTHKESTINNITTVISASYSDKNYNFNLTTGSESTSNSIKMKAPYYDNEMVYYVLRSIDMEENDKYNFTFNCPSPIDNDSQNRTAALVGKADVGGIMGNIVNCYQVSMVANQRISGNAFTLYYAVNPITINNLQIVTPLVKFVENNITYTLTSLEASEL